jgi:DNA-directed RNA polymerase specialized sigma24 family protein
MEKLEPDATTLLRALVALQIADRQERGSSEPSRPTEVVLADAGLGLSDIGELTGRKYETVKATIRRARATGAKGSATEKDAAKPTAAKPKPKTTRKKA